MRYAVVTLRNRPGGTVRTFADPKLALEAVRDEWRRVDQGARGMVYVINTLSDRLVDESELEALS